jgi:hypothetical protein
VVGKRCGRRTGAAAHIKKPGDEAIETKLQLKLALKAESRQGQGPKQKLPGRIVRLTNIFNTIDQ